MYRIFLLAPRAFILFQKKGKNTPLHSAVYNIPCIQVTQAARSGISIFCANFWEFHKLTFLPWATRPQKTGGMTSPFFRTLFEPEILYFNLSHRIDHSAFTLGIKTRWLLRFKSRNIPVAGPIYHHDSFGFIFPESCICASSFKSGHPGN